MRIYLSGPMRGIKDSNFPEFIRIADRLRAAGHDVLNPAESAVVDRDHMVRSDYLRHDIQLIMVVDAVVVIPGWYSSPGARFEVAEAWQIGIPVYYYQDEACPGCSLANLPRSGHTLTPLVETSVVIPREDQYVKRTPLIALSGFAGSGKDEIAKTLVSELGFTRIAFADPLKQIARDLGWDGVKDEGGRRFLQNLGVSVREVLDTEAWVRRAEDSIELIDAPVVITDCRFPNEVAMVRRRKGHVVRIVRPGTGAVNEHISEHAITDADADAVFVNDGSLDELPARVLEFFGSLGVAKRDREDQAAA